MVGLVVAMHANIGALIHYDHAHKELQDASIIFCKWIYAPPTRDCLYNNLQGIPLLGLFSSTWLIPDMGTSKAF